MRERYFGTSDDFEVVDADNFASSKVAAAKAAVAQSKKAPPVKATLMEKLLEERTKEALEGAQKQQRIVVQSYEERLKIMGDALKSSAAFIREVAEGRAGRSEAQEYLRTIKL